MPESRNRRQLWQNRDRAYRECDLGWASSSSAMSAGGKGVQKHAPDLVARKNSG